MDDIKNIKINQVTSVEHLCDNETYFEHLINLVKSGNAKCVVDELKELPKSDLESFTYRDIVELAGFCGEYIVYDDFNYILAANEDIIVLYQRI